MLSFEPSESAGMSDRVTRLRIVGIVNRFKVECYVGTATRTNFDQVCNNARCSVYKENEFQVD